MAEVAELVDDEVDRTEAAEAAAMMEDLRRSDRRSRSAAR